MVFTVLYIWRIIVYQLVECIPYRIDFLMFFIPSALQDFNLCVEVECSSVSGYTPFQVPVVFDKYRSSLEQRGKMLVFLLIENLVQSIECMPWSSFHVQLPKLSKKTSGLNHQWAYCQELVFQNYLNQKKCSISKNEISRVVLLHFVIIISILPYDALINGMFFFQIHFNT